MSNLRRAAQRALKAMEDGEDRADMIEFSDALIALRAALAEPEQPFMAEYKFRSFGWYPDADGKMQLGEIPQRTELEQAITDSLTTGTGWLKDGKRIDPASVYAEPEQEPFMVVAPECAERGCMAHDDRVDGSGIVVHLRKEQEEVRRLHAELERKSDAIQRLWKERDELRAVLTKIVGSK